MDDENLSLMPELKFDGNCEISDARGLSHPAALPRQQLEHGRPMQHQWQGSHGTLIVGSYYPQTYNPVQNQIPYEENFAWRRSAPLPNLGRGNLEDDWLPDEIDMGLHDELRLPRTSAHDPNLDVEMHEEPPSPLVYVPKQQCIACREEFSIRDLVSVPCGHYYCRECLRSLFNTACRSESSFPAQCCQRQIHLTAEVAALLTDEIMKHYEEKRIEFQTNDRTYCHNCSSFINPACYRHLDPAPCSKCSSLTCSRCKSKNHFGNCQPDAGARQVIALAKEKGWKRCYNCEEMVELKDGCNHMQCRCGAGWCYACGKKWQTCNCVQSNGAQEGDRFGVFNGPVRDIRQRARLVLPQRAEFGDVRYEMGHCRHPEIRAVVPPKRGCVWCDNQLVHILRCLQCDIEGCLDCLDSVRGHGMR